MRLRAGGEAEHVPLEEVISQEAGVSRFNGQIPGRRDQTQQSENGRPLEHDSGLHSPGNQEIAAVSQSDNRHAQEPLGQDRQSQK